MTKADYQRRIWTYRKRRLNLSKKIRKWEACLRNRRDNDKKRKAVLSVLVKSINEYFEVDIKKRVYDKRHRLARNIYFKVGLDLKYWGTNLSRFIGRNKQMAARGRRTLLSSFKEDEKTKLAYHNFKKYFESE